MDTSILDVLPLRPIDLCRLGRVHRGLRNWFNTPEAEGIWRAAAARSWGATGVHSRATAADHGRTSMEFDEAVAVGSTVHVGSQSCAALQLGSALPYRIAAATGSVPVSSERAGRASHTVEWSVSVERLPESVAVLWIGVTFDGRGAVATDGSPRRLHVCKCTGASMHEKREGATGDQRPACPLHGATIWDALRPFQLDPKKRGMLERWSDTTTWKIAALSCTGGVWGAAIEGSRVHGMPSFSEGDVVHVSLRLAPEMRGGSLAFAVNSGPWVTAVKQLFPPRWTPRPVYFYPIVHLTDIAHPPPSDDLPVEATVRVHAARTPPPAL
jgi:hypothetical protein